MVTAGNEVLRGKASARFEGATLLGLGAGFAVAPLLFAAFGPAAFFLNALIYGVSFLIFRRSRIRPARPRRRRRRTSASAATRELHPDLARLAAGADLDRGERGDRAVVQPVDLPVRQGRTRSSPTRR